MTAMIDAPRIAGRDRAREDLATVPLGPTSVVAVQFPDRASATPSYLDELVSVVCTDNGATLILRGLSGLGRDFATESADRRNVSSLVVLEP